MQGTEESTKEVLIIQIGMWRGICLSRVKSHHEK